MCLTLIKGWKKATAALKKEMSAAHEKKMTFYKKYDVYRDTDKQYFLVAPYRGTRVTGPGLLQSDRKGLSPGDDDLDEVHSDSATVARGIHVYHKLTRRKKMSVYTMDDELVITVYLKIEARVQDLVATERYDCFSDGTSFPNGYHTVFTQVSISKKEFNRVISFAKAEERKHKRKVSIRNS